MQNRHRFPYQDQFGGPGPTTDESNTMHRYGDAIVLPQVLGGCGYELGINDVKLDGVLCPD